MEAESNAVRRICRLRSDEEEKMGSMVAVKAGKTVPLWGRLVWMHGSEEHE